MSYVILLNGKQVDRAESEIQARTKAEEVQNHASRYVDDEFFGAHSIVGFAPSSDLSCISHLKPRDSVPDALVPLEFKQFR